jgi:hypothetical protein
VSGALRRGSVRASWIGAALVVGLLLVWPGVARAALSWSGPITIDDNGGQGLVAVACPSTTQCTAVDGLGQEVTFNPGSPAIPTPTSIDDDASLVAVACPTTTQCTAVDGRNQEVTFNPTAPGTPTPVTIDDEESGFGPTAIACPLTTQCTAVDGYGREVSFNPTDPGSPTPVAIENEYNLTGIACWSASQCTAVDGFGHELTFNPSAPGTPTAHTIDGGIMLNGVACASATECIAVDDDGHEVMFDPTGPGSPTAVVIDTDAGASDDDLNSVACLSMTECTAVDGSGRQVTFNPISPGTPSVVTVDSYALSGVACPLATPASASECTGVDASGREVTFGPAGAAVVPTPPSQVDNSNSLTAVACPSSSQCTGVDYDGFEVTFDPAIPGNPTPLLIDSPDYLLAVACPTAMQCTAVGNGGREVTFNPMDPEMPTPVVVDSGGYTLTAVACPAGSTTQCTAVDNDGHEVTFDPTGLVTPTAHTIDGTSPLSAIACPSASQCTATDGSGSDVVGHEVTFNPTSPGTPAAVQVDTLPFGYVGLSGFYLDVAGIACPSAGQCTIVDNYGRELTFDPTSPGTPNAIVADYTVADLVGSYPGSYYMVGVSCASTSQCSAIDNVGGEVTFDPSAPSTDVLNPVFVDGSHSDLTGLACSSDLCTAVDSLGNEMTFNPTAPYGTTPVTIDGAQSLESVTCVSTSQCTAVDSNEQEVTFDPTAPGSPNPLLIGVGGGVACLSASSCVAVGGDLVSTFDPTAPGSALTEVDGTGFLEFLTCWSATQCVAMQPGGEEVSFDPAGVGSPGVYQADPSFFTVGGFACASASQCTAVDADGYEATFNPMSVGSPADMAIESPFYALDGVACASASQCTAVDMFGNAVTFDPTDPGTPAPTSIDGSNDLTGVSCPSSAFCVAIDAYGDAIDGDPAATASWEVSHPSGANAFTAIYCASASWCIAVDKAGHAFIGTPDGAVVPANSGSLPTISGIDDAGQILTATNVAWTNSPTSYSYQWETCNGSGGACAVIQGASAQTYAPTTSEEGETIRVEEFATNAGGTGGPVSSAATAPIELPAPTNTLAPLISGQLWVGGTLTETHGTWTGNPTSYGYQWEDCDGNGNNCSAIAGATAPTYVETTSDVGHTIRIEEFATNAGGTGGPASSSATVYPTSATQAGAGGSSGTTTVTTASGAPTATFLGASVSASTVSVEIECSGTGGQCAGAISAAATEKLAANGKTLVAVAAKHKPKRTKGVVVAQANFTIGAGQTQTDRLGLNATGKLLLVRFKHVPAGLQVTATGSGGQETIIGSATVVFRPAKPKKHKHS